MFDAVLEFNRQKSRFAATRGVATATGLKTSTGQLLIPTGKAVPRTTWQDVTTFGLAFLGRTSNRAIETCLKTGSIADCGRPFVETSSFNRALENWTSTFPMQKLLRTYALLDVPTVLGLKLRSNEIYPWNEEFWGYGSRYAIARSAAGEVPGQFDIAIESIKEAVQELPANIAKVVDAVTPDLKPAIDLTRWLTIGAAVGLAWYVAAKWKR